MTLLVSCAPGLVKLLAGEVHEGQTVTFDKVGDTIKMV